EPAKIRVGLGPARGDHHAGQPLRMFEGQDLRHRPAGRMADDMRLGDAQSIHQLHHILRHALDGIGDPAVVALPDAAVVVQHDLEALGESGNLVTPIGPVAAQAADEEDGKTGAMPLAIELAVANRNARHGTEARLASLSLWLNIRAAVMSNAPGTGQPCAKPHGMVIAPLASLAMRAFAGSCEACGLAEPDHAASVNGRAAEPINSMGAHGGRVSGRTTPAS